MCKASPFPRCESHAKAKLAFKHAKMQSAYNAYTTVKTQELDKQSYLQRDHNSVENNPKVVKALEKSRKAQKEYDEAVSENSITLSSLKSLKDQIIDIRTHLQNPKLNPTVESYDYTEDGVQKLEARYLKLLSQRQKRIQEYDRIHHTVNGRKPSSKGTIAGVKELKAQQAKAFDSWMTALEQNLPDKVVKLRAKNVEKIQKEYSHARETLLQKRNKVTANKPSPLEGENNVL